MSEQKYQLYPTVDEPIIYRIVITVTVEEQIRRLNRRLVEE